VFAVPASLQLAAGSADGFAKPQNAMGIVSTAAQCIARPCPKHRSGWARRPFFPDLGMIRGRGDAMLLSSRFSGGSDGKVIEQSGRTTASLGENLAWKDANFVLPFAPRPIILGIVGERALFLSSQPEVWKPCGH
jgi:hypothetical protein